MTRGQVVTFAVLGEGHLAGTLRYGQVRGVSVHGAACRQCGLAQYEYDHADFSATAMWLNHHLWTAHGVPIHGLYRDASTDTYVRRGVVSQAIASIGGAWEVPLTVADLITCNGVSPWGSRV